MADVLTAVETAARLTLKGVHGTSRSAAREIARHQTFQKTDKGRVGTGMQGHLPSRPWLFWAETRALDPNSILRESYQSC